MSTIEHTFSGKIPIKVYDQGRQFYEKLLSMGYRRKCEHNNDRPPNFELLKWFFVYPDKTFICCYVDNAENINLPLHKEPAIRPSIWNRRFVTGKVPIKGHKHGAKLINKLFKMGYKWHSALCNVPNEKVLEQVRFVLLYENGIMECIFNGHSSTEGFKEYRIIKP